MLRRHPAFARDNARPDHFSSPHVMNAGGALHRTGRLPAETLASWYMPGLTDGFGDRLLMFDNTGSDAVELLRFHPELAATPGFGEVVDANARRLGRVTHPAFPSVRGVERLDSDGSLVLVSAYTAGTRLSAILGEGRFVKGMHPAFVMSVIGQILQPISILQGEEDDAAHGALTADRIILAPNGQVRVVEHVLGAALRHLDRSPGQLWQDFGLLVPPDEHGTAGLDGRGDVFQLGLLALSMMLGQRMTPEDIDRLPALLDQWRKTVVPRSKLFGNPLESWLERALQLGERPYRSAAEACADFRQFPAVSAATAFEFLHAGLRNRVEPPLLLAESTEPANHREASMSNGVFPGDRINESSPRPEPVRIHARGSLLGLAAPAPEPAPALPTIAAGPSTVAAQPGRNRVPIAVGLTAVALVQGLVIAILLVRQPPDLIQTPVAAASLPPPPELATGTTKMEPPALAAGLDVSALPPAPTVTAASVASSGVASLDRGSDDAIARAASRQRSGGIRLSAPIELKVLQGDLVLGSSADGPIVTTAGNHELDFINTALGFRTRRPVTFRAGEITTINIAIPPSRVSVNAIPWAEVWIDGRAVGETPLANLEIPIGEHDVVFRHPELGERRQRVTVRADAVTRISATFD